MHPPWITFNFLLLLIALTVSGEAEQNGGDNSTVSRPQREIYERERRLIPYMTYYITQSLTTPNTVARQSVFAPPIVTPRENVFQIDAVPKIPLNTIQNVNPQQIEILPKPVIRLPSPSFLSPTIQAYKPKEDNGIFPQLYRLESGVIRPRIHPQIQQQQVQSETQPLQVVKVNPVPVEQKYPAPPQLIKIIPIITKLPQDDRSAKSYAPQRFAYSTPNIHPLAQDASDQNYYKEPQRPENSYQDNKVYANSIARENLRLIGPSIRQDANKYTIAKIIISTTPSPYTEIKFNDGAVNPVPVAPGYGRGTVISTVPSYTADKYVTPRQQLYYSPKANAEQGQEQQENIQKTEQIPRLRVPLEEKIRFVATVTPVPVTNDLDGTNWKAQDDGDKVYDKQSLNNIFALLKETNKLPQNLTPDNIDTGIKTLALILERLQEQRNYQSAQSAGTTTSEAPQVSIKHQQNNKKVHSFPEKSGTSTPGRPGVDYPIYSSIPQTNFDCSTQRYKGFFGDPDTNCQVWHYCDLNGGQASFLCPNGTIFSQVALTCDWWFNVKCASTSQLYVLNERLYKYILPFSPSFPEDYSGPVVDTYLAAKFKEMEAKSKSKALKSVTNSTTTEKPAVTTEAQTELPTESVEYQTLGPEV